MITAQMLSLSNNIKYLQTERIDLKQDGKITPKSNKFGWCKLYKNIRGNYRETNSNRPVPSMGNQFCLALPRCLLRQKCGRKKTRQFIISLR